jgi:GNAT superfamily N-acetyltransferase
MQTRTITIRATRPDELDWVNQRYAEIDFVPSTLDDLIAIAEVDGVRAGLGRIVTVGQHGELGGMYVLEPYQGLGLARRLVEWLTEQRGHLPLWCLPFSELKDMYGSFGFLPSGGEDAPAAVLKKHRWCNEHYPKPVLLLQRAPS